MPRKALIVGALVALVGLVAAAIAVASSSQAELTKPETIHVVQRGGQITFLPINPKKDVFTGDLVVVNGPVFDASGKTKVGWQHAECTVMEPKGVVAECAIETFLQHGMIAVKGPTHFGVDDRSRGAITGGTGRYRNARGQVTFLNSSGPMEGLIFRLEP